jgi:hypothetical protein
MNRKFSVVTTFNQAGYEKYGHKMIDTFLKNWPQDVHLYVYAEDCVVTQSAPNLVVYDFVQKVPALTAFKNTWRNVPKANGLEPLGPPDRKGKQPGIGFRWDAIRFSHKVYAVCDAARETDADVLFWMDADMVCHSPVTTDFISSQIPTTTGLAFLGRKNKFTECGLYAMNLRNVVTQAWLVEFQLAYDSGRLFTMSEWNDCWVFDRTREETGSTHKNWHQLNWNSGTNQGEGHPLINTDWGKFLDHLKGARKDLGHSKSSDLVQPRAESYWTSVRS